MKTKQIKKYSVYFATNTNEQTKEIKQLICSIFGGYSLHSIKGGWHDEEERKIIEEDSFFCEVLTNKDDRHIKNLCEHITKIANQKEVFYIEQDINLNIIRQI
tara:strand:- start:59 stop:367 length:309 start_codon:yes stop_codon:yes gene_type:complete